MSQQVNSSAGNLASSPLISAQTSIAQDQVLSLSLEGGGTAQPTSMWLGALLWTLKVKTTISH